MAKRRPYTPVPIPYGDGDDVQRDGPLPQIPSVPQQEVASDVQYVPGIYTEELRAPAGLEGAEAVAMYCYDSGGRCDIDGESREQKTDQDPTIDNEYRKHFRVMPVDDEDHPV